MVVWRADSRACCLVENWVWRRVDVMVEHSVEWRVELKAVDWVVQMAVWRAGLTASLTVDLWDWVRALWSAGYLAEQWATKWELQWVYNWVLW
jgi:hypothetical protein